MKNIDIIRNLLKDFKFIYGNKSNLVLLEKYCNEKCSKKSLVVLKSYLNKFDSFVNESTFSISKSFKNFNEFVLLDYNN